MLANKLALITGSGSGIGLSVAQHFAKQGARLALVDLTPNVVEVGKQLEQQTKVFTSRCDISESGQVNKLFEEIQQAFPDLKAPNVIVNCAGITRDSMFLKMKEEDFDQVIKVNLKGTYLVSQAAARSIIQNNPKNSGGSIINFASIVGKLGNLGQANYTASKAGVEGLTRTIARELGKHNIRCNAILPGFIKTPMTDKVPDKYLELIVGQIPLGRMGSPDDIAQLATFLASDNSSYITGASIECTGGLSF